MKILSLTIFIITSIFTQTPKVEKLEITPNNVNGYLVKEYENKSANEIYTTLKKWTQYNIKNADYAINNDIENEYLSFNINGVGEVKYKDSNKWIWRLNLYVEVRIKNNKVRLDIIINEIDGVGGLESLPITTNDGIRAMNSLFKKDGSPRKATATYREDVNKSLNDFANELFTSINGIVDHKKEGW